MVMNDEIGRIAGEIWHLLTERGEMSLSGVVMALNTAQSTAYMALGWLAREDKLEFVKKRRGIVVRLK
ncbi:MAG: winged helix-turn-helix domain-containing protein [Candidatus Methanospirareceae archaeon]